MRAAVYARVSTLLQAKDGYSLEWQVENLPKLARQAGNSVTKEDIFVEVMSGAKDDRPEYNRLMTLIMEGYYKEVWVVEKSRLSRTEDRTEEQRIINALQKFGCVIRTPSMTFDVSTFEGELFNDVDSSFNRYERKRIKYRLQNGKVSKIKKGGYAGGNPPTGYRTGGRDPDTGKMRFEIDPGRAEMVKYAFQLALGGKTFRGIEKILYEEGYRNSKGGRIYADTVSRWLKNPHYAGYTQSLAKKILVEANLFLEPIISKEEFSQLQGQLKRRSIVRDKRVQHPLSGILTCGNCGRGFKVDIYGGGRKVYTCSSKSKSLHCRGTSPKSIYYDVAHQLMIDFLPDFIAFLESKVPTKKKKAVQVSVTKLERLKTQKASLYKKIMMNIRQQEDSFSEIRKERIIELETEYKNLEIAIEAEKNSNVTYLPNLEGWGPLLAEMTTEDISVLQRIIPALFSKIHIMKRGHWHSHRFEVSRIFTAWGDEYNVDYGSRLRFYLQ